jgi:hypothetical protein
MSTTTTAAPLFPFVPNGVRDITEGPFTIPVDYRPAFMELAANVDTFTKYAEGRDYPDNHEGAVRTFAKAHALHIESRPEPFAPGMYRDRELAPNEIADRILNEYGVSARGVWAWGLAAEYARTTTLQRAREFTSRDMALALATCPVCGGVDHDHLPRMRRHAISGDSPAAHWRVASLVMCDECFAVAMETVTAKAAAEKMPNGKTRKAIVTALLAE